MKTQQTTAARITSIVKIGASRQVIIPKKIHDRLGLRAGDYLEIELNDDTLLITPKALVEKRLAEAFADIKHGRVHGPYHSAEDIVRSLRLDRKSPHT